MRLATFVILGDMSLNISHKGTKGADRVYPFQTPIKMLECHDKLGSNVIGCLPKHWFMTTVKDWNRKSNFEGVALLWKKSM